jgi:hypothetical protein
MRRGVRAGILSISLVLTFALVSPAASGATAHQVSIRLSAGTIRSDRLAKVTGSVSPRAHGTVWLYRYEHGWHRVTSTALNSHSTYAISFAPPRPGTFDYRVTWGHVASRSVRLTVREAPPVWDSCRPSNGITGWDPDFPVGAVIRTKAYLYAPSFFFAGKTYPFTLKEIAYSSGVGETQEWKCEINLPIPVGYGPNQVEPLPNEYEWSDIRVRDTHGHVITGWTGILDSKHVSVVGVGIHEYYEDNGRPGTDTLRLRALASLP